MVVSEPRDQINPHIGREMTLLFDTTSDPLGPRYYLFQVYDIRLVNVINIPKFR